MIKLGSPLAIKKEVFDVAVLFQKHTNVISNRFTDIGIGTARAFAVL